VGFSDVTALHAAWARAGVRSLHAPMVSALGRAGGALVDRWMSAVEGATPEPIGHLTALAGRGQAEGPLVGGNLAVLAALAGTPFAPPLDGSILFLEDVGERPYRIDRMLTTLRHAGWLERVSGVVLGAFTGAEPAPDGTTSDEVLAERLGDLSVPVLGAIPAGHVDDNLELPLGARVALDGTRGELRFLEAATV
jgi:muramoyltetrapeptide carboxypeptidase